MKQQLIIAVRMTIVTTILLGIVYPMVVTGIAQMLFPAKANGELIYSSGKAIGSKILGQPFAGEGYFHSRPSVAGAGYDATSSGGSNLSPTNRKFVDQVSLRVAADSEGASIPVDLVTASGSGLDPHITPAAAEYQLGRVARARNLSEPDLRMLIRNHTEGRQLGFLGEARLNVLELNLDLDRVAPLHDASHDGTR